MTFMDRVHHAEGSASFAPLHIRIQSYAVASPTAAAAAACPYALALFPACFIEGRGPEEGVNRDERRQRKVKIVGWMKGNGVKGGIEWMRTSKLRADSLKHASSETMRRVFFFFKFVAHLQIF